MNTIRQPAVADLFYPADPTVLKEMLKGFLAEVAVPVQSAAPKALIVPHAGYPYSGPVAASAYARLSPVRAVITRVILLGPTHRVPLRGLASSSATAFRTPLGDVPLDRAAIEEVEKLPQVRRYDLAHAQEHSLEVHLPFLQTVLERFAIVPLVVGEARAEEVAEVLKRLWGGDETLIVISSDLSHYLDYATAQARDRSTSTAIVGKHLEDIGYEDACGRGPMSGLLWLARERDMAVEMVDLRNSGDTAGDKTRVVGYGAYVVH